MRPDLIVMDVAMQGMSGHEATRHLRRMPGLDKTPIIASSASVSAAQQAASLAAECDGFLAKPVHVEALLATLEQHLKLRWIRRQSASPPPAAAPLEAGKLPGTFAIPPAVLRVMLDLAESGRVPQLRKLVNDLGDDALQRTPWLGQLRSLAERFQTKELRELLRAQVLARGAADPA